MIVPIKVDLIVSAGGRIFGPVAKAHQGLATLAHAHGEHDGDIEIRLATLLAATTSSPKPAAKTLPTANPVLVRSIPREAGRPILRIPHKPSNRNDNASRRSRRSLFSGYRS